MRVEHLKAMGPKAKNPMANALSAKGFNKEAFINAQTTEAKNRAEIKATYMEKLYNILTPEQREQWVKNMESRPNRS
jgi:Spy/CpxP family protein refolding chaperone